MGYRSNGFLVNFFFGMYEYEIFGNLMVDMLRFVL